MLSRCLIICCFFCNKIVTLDLSGVTSELEHELRTHSINDKMPGEYGQQRTTFIERLGANADSWLERAFYRWGKFCAERPWLVLFLGGCVIVALGHGIKYLKITTDPVELWASPNSRSRIEKEYYDSHFQPFYRTEQVGARLFVVFDRLLKDCQFDSCYRCQFDMSNYCHFDRF